MSWMNSKMKMMMTWSYLTAVKRVNLVLESAELIYELICDVASLRCDGLGLGLGEVVSCV